MATSATWNQVGDQHVERRSGEVVELGAVGDLELLRDIDLHLRDVFAAPDCRQRSDARLQPAGTSSRGSESAASPVLELRLAAMPGPRCLGDRSGARIGTLRSPNDR
jgi:hypothetical protein